MTSKPIVVAVGAGESEALLDFSTREAMLSGSPLHLVHVVRMPPTLPSSLAAAYQTAQEYGAEVLRQAVAGARARVGSAVVVTSELVTTGAPAAVLAGRSADARMVVLQHRHLTGTKRLTSASTTSGVAARAHAPVVSVPEAWRPPDGAEPGPVVVGVHDPARSREIMRAGFTLARERGADLRIVHAWWLANGYDGIVVDDAMREAEKERFGQEVAPDLDALRAEHPGVNTVVSVYHAPAALALDDVAEGAQLLVLGRRNPTLAVGSHLGSVVRTVLRQSPVPVVVVEPSAAMTASGGERRDTAAR
ncbi:hypothetical protein GGQ22_15725 [Nocardioides sp. zg-579]|uniref:UspA domain-containing protein n=1 Tax=Nocardioides marmotae TaxID=2663857 RepID=A0A6I3JE94_9ACTN|nr:universal stress protein [Nocardioides marmotae]MCR6032874.1 hypothetical protein [Gordonia jinghuaiqii]MTB96524.1 hypothetical protein [Nocardioides marmotae]QKE01955.1 universal stress protein [Nocardioides marmotae]